jgi:hypothetical protein
MASAQFDKSALLLADLGWQRGVLSKAHLSGLKEPGFNMPSGLH